MRHVLGAPHADAVARGMEQEVLISIHQNTHIFPGAEEAVVAPGPKIVGIGRADDTPQRPFPAIGCDTGPVGTPLVLVEAPPLAVVVLVLEEVGINHAVHRGHRHIRAFDQHDLRVTPVDQIVARHRGDAR